MPLLSVISPTFVKLYCIFMSTEYALGVPVMTSLFVLAPMYKMRDVYIECGAKLPLYDHSFPAVTDAGLATGVYWPLFRRCHYST